MTGLRRFVAFDLGAESGRCVVATLRNGSVEQEEVHRFSTHSVRQNGGLHWDIMAIEAEVVEGLVKAGKQYGPLFDGIGVDTWGVDYVLIDHHARSIGQPYHYRDSRTDHMMEEAFAIVPKDELYQSTGIQFAQFNTLFQLLAEKRAPSNRLQAAAAMLLMPDYLNCVLSGARKAEFTIASTTGLADPRTRNWNWSLIERLGIPQHVFPPMIEPGTRVGSLRGDLAARTGLDPRTPIVASAGHDTASAVASVPATEEGWAFLSSGTWSLMGVELAAPLVNSAALRYNFTNEGGAEGSTRFLKNIIGLWPVQECRRHWLEKGEEFSYAQLAELAKEEGFVRAWVNLDDPRFLKPGDMPGKIMSYLTGTGQESRSSPGFIIRVVLESLAFSYRKTIDEIEEVTGRPVGILHAVGGGIRNELLMELTANAIGRRVVAGPIEGAVIGNVGVQAIACGAVENMRAWRALVAKSFPLRVYEPHGRHYFDDNQERFVGCLMRSHH